MSTNAIVGLVVAVVVVGAAVWYYSNSSSTDVPQGMETGQIQEEMNNGTGPLASLFAMSGSYRCTVSSNTSNSATDGVVYISNGQVRGDFASSVSATGGGNIQAHMIKSGDDVYVWSDAMPQGMKMKASVMMGASGSNQAFDPNVSVNYSCEPVMADASMFVAPTNISFMSL